jgi:large subunit ribosomal protein L25
MLSLKAKIRKESGKKVEKLRKNGQVPAVLYGPKIDNLSLEVNQKEFSKALKIVGESSLLQLEVGDKNFMVLVHSLDVDPLSQNPIHIDFYQPKLDQEITVTVPLMFEGESLAVKSLGGTLIKNIHEVEVRAFPQHLPHEIKVDVGKLDNFGDSILAKDLILPEGVKVLRGPDEIIVLVAEPQKVEEELAKPIEEKVEDVEKVEGKKPVEEAEVAEVGKEVKKKEETKEAK